ncbi:MAG: ArsR/SmtB family transcription factor [Chromatiales bacterium]
MPDVLRRNATRATRLLRALSSPLRLMILCRLVEGECGAGDLGADSGLTQSAVSQHLAMLRRDGIVTTRRDGRSVYYTLASGEARRLIALLHELYREKGAMRRKGSR